MILLICICLVFSSKVWAQGDSSINWMAHLRQPDYAMVNDTILFPYDEPGQRATYAPRDDHFRWAGKGARSYGDFRSYYTAEITLGADHRFVFDAGFEVGASLTVGEWWDYQDSIVCLQWDGPLSLKLCTDAKAYNQFFHAHRKSYFTAWPTRISGWEFVRRGDSLVPRDHKATITTSLIDSMATNAEQWIFLVTIKNVGFDKYWVQDTTGWNKQIEIDDRESIHVFIWLKVNGKYQLFEEYKNRGDYLYDGECDNCVYFEKGQSISLRLQLLNGCHMREGDYKIQVEMGPPIMSCDRCPQLPEIESDYLYFRVGRKG